MKNILFLFYISITAVSYCQVEKMDSLELYNYLNDEELLYDYDYLFIDTSVINNDVNRKWDVVFTKSNEKSDAFTSNFLYETVVVVAHASRVKLIDGFAGI